MPGTRGKLHGSSATINRDAGRTPRPSRVPLKSDGNCRSLQLGGKSLSACKLNVRFRSRAVTWSVCSTGSSSAAAAVTKSITNGNFLRTADVAGVIYAGNSNWRILQSHGVLRISLRSAAE